jgi:hypothetical protein
LCAMLSDAVLTVMRDPEPFYCVHFHTITYDTVQPAGVF